MLDRQSDRSLVTVSRREALSLGMAAGLISIEGLHAAANRIDPFIVKPYLQLGDAPSLATSEQLVVMWHALDEYSLWSVEQHDDHTSRWLPAASLNWNRIAVDSIPPHRVYRATLAGLKPGAAVFYRVRRNGEIVFTAQGTARKSADKSYRFVVMGDCGTGELGQKKVAYQVHRQKPDFVMIPGDIVYNHGRVSEYRSSFFPIYAHDEALPDSGAPLQRSTLFLTGLGEHDCEASLNSHPDAFAYYMYWSQPLNGPDIKVGSSHNYPLGGPRNRQAATLGAMGDRYPKMANYSFDFGNSHWTVLDTWNPHIDWNDVALRAWLKDDLSQAKHATWKFVSAYLPPFNSSTAYPHTQKMRVIVDLLQDAGVDIVFSGYAHSYQRTFPLRFTADPVPQGPVKEPGHVIPGEFTFDKQFDGAQNTKVTGVLYIVSGGGGNSNLHSPEQTENPKTWQPFTVKYHASLNQFSLIEIHRGTLIFKQISLNGDELDRFTLTK